MQVPAQMGFLLRSGDDGRQFACHGFEFLLTWPRPCMRRTLWPTVIQGCAAQMIPWLPASGRAGVCGSKDTLAPDRCCLMPQMSAADAAAATRRQSASWSRTTLTLPIMRWRTPAARCRTVFCAPIILMQRAKMAKTRFNQDDHRCQAELTQFSRRSLSLCPE